MRRRGVALTLFLGIYGLLTVPWVFWPIDAVAWAFTTFALYALLAVGLAADTTEVILALYWPSQAPPWLAGAAPRDLAAVVMTVCDDASAEHLTTLRSLADAGYATYLLDDSVLPVALSKEWRLTHIRRHARTGAKAGNLNHWVTHYGDNYKYAVLLDADSTISVEAIDTLLLTAEHPDNSDVAIFQAKVEPAGASRSLFAWALSAGARPRIRVIERVHGPLGLLLSFGHNQLLRLAPICTLGGFDETLTSEDTVLSLDLAAAGWRIELVDVWSQDTDPETITAYIRRTMRWARQTVELFHRPWYAVPLRLKLLLCRHLLAYTLPLVGCLLLGLSLWMGPETPESAWEFLAASLSLIPGYRLYGLTLWPTLGVFFLFITLRTVLARQEGVPWRVLMLSSIFGNAPYAALLLPLAGAMLASAFGSRVRFVPTNSSQARKLESRTSSQILRGTLTGVLLATLVAGVLRRPGSLLVGLNLVWVTQLLLSPVSMLILLLVGRLASLDNCTAREVTR